MLTANLDKTKQNHPIRIWDAPTRLFHWGLASCFLVAWLTRDGRYLDIHVFSGYMMAGLLLFRLVWGFLGGSYARFSSFAYKPSTALLYVKSLLRPHPERFLGHNPAGSWAIYALLLLGLTMAATGLITLGGEEGHGPLAGWFGFEQGEIFHLIHEYLAWLMLSLVTVHILGVLIESLLHHENLALSMLSGYKRSSERGNSSPAYWSVAAGMLFFALGGGLVWFAGYITETPEAPYLPFKGPKLADDPLWRAECGSCHLAFHPSLLPKRSWKATMQGQSDHFGDDLALDEETAHSIEAFMLNNAAEQFPTEAAWKIYHSIPADEIPLSITQTAYWQDKHGALPETIWTHSKVNGKSNCGACHLDAEAGTFQDAAMRLPKAG